MLMVGHLLPVPLAYRIKPLAGYGALDPNQSTDVNAYGGSTAPGSYGGGITAGSFRLW